MTNRYSYLPLIYFTSSVVAIFFLFTSGIHFAGGGSHFLDWALLLSGDIKTLNANDVSQRDIGYSLLLILTGFASTNSFVGTIIAQTLFAIIMPILIYMALAKFSDWIALITAMFCIMTLAPYVLIKFMYHDQMYMFLMLMSAFFAVAYVGDPAKHRFLILFTVSLLLASLSRSAGNYIYPIVLLLLFFILKKNRLLIILSSVIFISGITAYSWHRNDVFGDAENKNGVGLQLFYASYIPLGEVGLTLSRDLGPHTAQLIDSLDEYIGPEIETSRLMTNYGSAPAAFLDKHILSKSPEDLKRSLLNNPCEEYMWILYGANPNNDVLYKNVSMEILKAHPYSYLRHVLVNSYSLLFNPGLNFSRYHTTPQRVQSGVDFLPALPTKGEGGPGMQDARAYGKRLVSEIDERPLDGLPAFVRSLFENTGYYYVSNYRNGVSLTNYLILICWILLALNIMRVARGHNVSPKIRLAVHCALIFNLFFFYEVGITALFAGAHMRYFHFTELLRIAVCGCGLFFVYHELKGSYYVKKMGYFLISWLGWPQEISVPLSGRRPIRGTVIAIISLLNVASLCYWTIAHISSNW